MSRVSKTETADDLPAPIVEGYTYPSSPAPPYPPDHVDLDFGLEALPRAQQPVQGYGKDAHEAIRALSGRWVLTVLTQLSGGPRYHNDLARSAGVRENKSLDRALRCLLQTCMVDRTIDNIGGSAPRVRYGLTQRGRSVLPIIHELAEWWRATELAK